MRLTVFGATGRTSDEGYRATRDALPSGAFSIVFSGAPLHTTWLFQRTEPSSIGRAFKRLVNTYGWRRSTV